MVSEDWIKNVISYNTFIIDCPFLWCGKEYQTPAEALLFSKLDEQFLSMKCSEQANSVLASYYSVTEKLCIDAKFCWELDYVFMLKRFQDVKPSLSREDIFHCDFYFYNIFKENPNIMNVMVRLSGFSGDLPKEILPDKKKNLLLENIPLYKSSFDFKEFLEFVSDSFKNLLLVGFSREHMEWFVNNLSNDLRVFVTEVVGDCVWEKDSSIKVVDSSAIGLVDRNDNCIVVNYEGISTKRWKLIDDWNNLFVLGEELCQTQLIRDVGEKR